MKKWIAVSALACLAPVSSFAALQPGYYDISGYQTICIAADRTWYGVSFAGWGGGWHSGVTGTTLYGNYAEGVGNDSVVLGPDFTGIWEEWRDDLSFEILVRSAYLAYLSADCPPPGAEGAGRFANPASR